MSVSISLVWPSSSITAAGLPPGSRRVAHSLSVRAEEARVAMCQSLLSLLVLLLGLLGVAVVDGFGRRPRSGRRGVPAGHEPILRDHLPETHEGLHDGGIVPGTGQV